jgi:hypothetical protein
MIHRQNRIPPSPALTVMTLATRRQLDHRLIVAADRGDLPAIPESATLTTPEFTHPLAQASRP